MTLIRNLYFRYITVNHPDTKVTLEDIDTRVLHQFYLRFVSRLLLFCYAFVLFKPAVPYIKDKISHTFWHQQHIATVHVENGKEHVHYEVKKLAEETENNKSTDNKQKSETSQDVCVIPANEEQVVPSHYAAKLDYPDRIFLFTLIDSDQDDRPPQAMVVNVQQCKCQKHLHCCFRACFKSLSENEDKL